MFLFLIAYAYFVREINLFNTHGIKFCFSMLLVVRTDLSSGIYINILRYFYKKSVHQSEVLEEVYGL